MESQCAIYEQQAEDEYRSKGRHTKQECIYLQQAADLRQEMATISTGGVQEYQQRKKRELDMRIREIVGILNPELLRRFDAGQVKKGGAAKAGAKAGAGAASGSGSTGSAAKGKDSDIDVSKWFKEIPLHTFEDVAGMDDLKEKLRQCVVDTRVGKLKEYLGIPRLHSFFFIGPPGCGKTYIVEAFAHELMEQNYKYISLTGSDILSRYVGDAEKIVSRMFQEAEENAPCILFVDEIDGVCKNRSLPNLPEHAATLTTAFLEGFNRINERKDPKTIIFIGATNYPGKVDNAMMDRVELIRVPFPDRGAREHAIRRQFKDILQFDADCSYDFMAEATEMYNYRDIVRLCNRLKNEIVRDIMTKYSDEEAAINALKDCSYMVERKQFETAKQNCLPAPKDAIIRSLDEWEEQYRRGIEGDD
jgi:SpoVK/Ycf46/Vps4 family AAA+-type ATPase